MILGYSSVATTNIQQTPFPTSSTHERPRSPPISLHAKKSEEDAHSATSFIPQQPFNAAAA